MAYLKVSPFPSYLATTDDNGDEEKGGQKGFKQGVQALGGYPVQGILIDPAVFYLDDL
jgi:hypothetical protein